MEADLGALFLLFVGLHRDLQELRGRHVYDLGKKFFNS